MNLFSKEFWLSPIVSKKKPSTVSQPNTLPKTSGAYRHHNWVGNRAVVEHFDGEKTPGELGYIQDLRPDHISLRHRAYSAQLKSDFVKIITGKFFKWVIGSGLKLQSVPNVEVLKSEGINLSQASDFIRIVEARFAVYSGSRRSDYTELDNLHVKAAEAFETAFLGGDCLCIMRVGAQNNVNVQIVDGQHIKTPFLETRFLEQAKQRGNTIKHGIEIDKKNRHIAYYVQTYNEKEFKYEFTRIPARGQRSKKTLAWMIYGSKHRIDHLRGIPQITQILEKIDKMDRYTEATVGAAEERAKIVLAIEHSKESDGENPFLNKVRLAVGKANNSAQETEGYYTGEKTASQIAATTQKQTFNMPIGAQLKAVGGANHEMEYGPFSKAVFIFLCASVDIPPEVALQMYEQNYSSSRAAINGWEHIVKVYRKRFSDKFYKLFYDLWLDMEILTGKIIAPGYLIARQEDNYMAVESYCSARFIGTNMPHIDPLKEVNAVRQMLGKNNTDALISRAQAAEMLGAGDWEKNNLEYTDESDQIPKEEVENEPNSENNQQPSTVGSLRKVQS